MAADPGPESGFGEALGTAPGKRQCPRVAGWLSGRVGWVSTDSRTQDPAPEGGRGLRRVGQVHWSPGVPLSTRRPVSNLNRDPVASEEPARRGSGGRAACFTTCSAERFHVRTDL